MNESCEGERATNIDKHFPPIRIILLIERMSLQLRLYRKRERQRVTRIDLHSQYAAPFTT